jgi:16S rRNA (uracil1498-N3)-methyltransferase
MSGKRFFVNKIADGRAVIAGEDYDHAIKVLRHKQGDIIPVFNPEHGEYNALIVSVDPAKREIGLEIKQQLKAAASHAVKITAAIALIKKDNFEFTLEKLTELGCDEIIPAITKRCVVKIKEEEKKSGRWEKIIYSAVKQSGRVTTPKLLPVADIKGIAANAAEVKYLVWEKETQKHLIDEAAKIASGSVLFFVGPEGGFEQSEALELTKQGFIPVSLGSATLRAETAAIAAAATLAQYFRRAGGA